MTPRMFFKIFIWGVFGIFFARTLFSFFAPDAPTFIVNLVFNVIFLALFIGLNVAVNRLSEKIGERQGDVVRAYSELAKDLENARAVIRDIEKEVKRKTIDPKDATKMIDGVQERFFGFGAMQVAEAMRPLMRPKKLNCIPDRRDPPPPPENQMSLSNDFPKGKSSPPPVFDKSAVENLNADGETRKSITEILSEIYDDTNKKGKKK